MKIQPAQSKRRRQAKQHARQQRDPEREQQHPAVDDDVVQAGDAPRSERMNPADARERHEESEPAARDCEQDAFGQELADDARAASPEGRADRNLPLPREGPRQQ